MKCFDLKLNFLLKKIMLSLIISTVNLGLWILLVKIEMKVYAGINTSKILIKIFILSDSRQKFEKINNQFSF
jgi:hypothetical protein